MADVTTSPRKLQEMTLPTADGHDVTTASGISLKQYEDQLNGLRKENFHLKLRIYFLEEKLGTGAPPAVQGLLEHNVRLQVEVEELRRQLTDKQELLAAAAEAIDVLEQQGSISNDSVDASMMNNTVPKKEARSQITERKQIADETCAESESAGDFLGVTVNNDDLDELTRLRRENRKALQLIKGCMKKIQQQDKEMKKLKLNKELAYAHVSDSQMEKYEEILKCKDEHIKDLENKVRELQKSIDSVQNQDPAGNLQELLTRRLQGLAYFLDKLLSHKCVLGEEKKKLAESILEQSLALPVGLKLDESMAPEEFTLEESNLDISQSLRMEDLTMMFGHHMGCSDENSRNQSRRLSRHVPQADIMSESECWSEPDRNVSFARVGLCDTGLAARESVSECNRYRSRRSKVSYGSRSEDNKIFNEGAMLEEITELTKRIEEIEKEKNDLNSKLDFSMTQIKDLIAEKDELKSILVTERANVAESDKNAEIMKNTVLCLESRIKDVEQQLAEARQLTDKMRTERQELESTFIETERSLRRAADEATVQASQAALERARAQHDRLRVERELEDIREKLNAATAANAQLEIEVARKVAMAAENKIVAIREALPSEEDRPTSPDQGIDSDRLSSLEQNDAVALSPRSLYEENVTLKQKLARTKATLADTLAQLNAANMRKRSVQRAICREIHKTQGVLRKARDQLENPNRYVVVVANLNDKHDRSAPSNFHWKTLKCRMIIFSNSSILACPDKTDAKEVHIIFNKVGDDFDKLNSLFLKFSLSQNGAIKKVTPEIFQTCFYYTMTAKLAPLWNTLGHEYLINNRDFLTKTEPHDGIKCRISCKEDVTILDLKPVKIHITRSDEDFRPGELIRVLPSLFKATIDNCYDSLPTSGSFKAYKDLRRHWKNIHGYRLPEDEGSYCTVQFWRGEPLTYPKLCVIRNFPIITPIPKTAEKTVLARFLSCLKNKMTQMLGMPLTIVQKEQRDDNFSVPQTASERLNETQAVSLCTPTQYSH